MVYYSDAETFNAMAAAHVDKLTFNTRDEYLVWVKSWKEEYRYLVAARKIEKLARFTKTENIDRANKLIERLKSTIDSSRLLEIRSNITKRMELEHGIKFMYWSPSNYNLLTYLSISRKASKLRAGVKMAERKKSQSAA